MPRMATSVPPSSLWNKTEERGRARTDDLQFLVWSLPTNILLPRWIVLALFCLIYLFRSSKEKKAWLSIGFRVGIIVQSSIPKSTIHLPYTLYHSTSLYRIPSPMHTPLPLLHIVDSLACSIPKYTPAIRGWIIEKNGLITVQQI